MLLLLLFCTSAKKDKTKTPSACEVGRDVCENEVLLFITVTCCLYLNHIDHFYFIIF